MPWDQRGEKRYYYRYLWQNGRAVRIYCGTGEVAELAATADGLLQVQREMDARQWQQEQERRAAALTLLDELNTQSDLLFRATLVVAGFHQHNRGSWRYRREHSSQDREA